MSWTTSSSAVTPTSPASSTTTACHEWRRHEAAAYAGVCEDTDQGATDYPEYTEGVRVRRHARSIDFCVRAGDAALPGAAGGGHSRDRRARESARAGHAAAARRREESLSGERVGDRRGQAPVWRVQ